MGIFKACDIRGVYQEELTKETALDIGRAIGTKIAGGAVLVGGDVRISTPELKEALIGGLLETGCRITDVGTLPTPAFYFAKRHLKILSGVMVTASHNPARYNGFKIALTDWPINEAEIKELEGLVKNRKFTPKAGGVLVHRDIRGDYTDFLKRSFFELTGEKLTGEMPGKRTGLKVVIDSGNGCYGSIAPQVFRDAGYDVIELFSEPDGRFPNREPNPAVAANLTALSQTIRAEKAHLGVAFDGDGDRVVFAAENGAVIESDKAIALLAQYFLRRYPGGKVVFDIKCSGLVPDEVVKAGGIPLMEKSGHAFIKTTLLREGAVLGGEISGHFFFDLLGGDDGLFAALLVASIVGKSGGRIASLIETLPQYHITPDLRVPYAGDDRETLLRELAARLEQSKDSRVSRLDGVRGEFAEGWGLVRLSVTEPLFTFRFESKGNYDVKAIKDRFLLPAPKLLALVNAVWDQYVK